MPKKIVSFALSQKSVEKIDETSQALGMNRSELIEFLVSKGFDFPEDVKANLDQITLLQKETKEKIRKEKAHNDR